MPDGADFEEWIDEADQAWLNSFIGEDKEIKPGHMVLGFVAVISYVDEDGNYRFRKYNTLDTPLSGLIGLLDVAKHEWLMENTTIKPKQIREEDEDG